MNCIFCKNKLIKSYPDNFEIELNCYCSHTRNNISIHFLFIINQKKIIILDRFYCKLGEYYINYQFYETSSQMEIDNGKDFYLGKDNFPFKYNLQYLEQTLKLLLTFN